MGVPLPGLVVVPFSLGVLMSLLETNLRSAHVWAREPSRSPREAGNGDPWSGPTRGATEGPHQRGVGGGEI